MSDLEQAVFDLISHNMCEPNGDDLSAWVDWLIKQEALIAAVKQKRTERKPYSPPRLRELCPVPMQYGRESTVWDMAQALDGWTFAGVYELYDFLVEGKQAGGTLDGLIVLVGQCIASAFRSEGART
jgi:hypothetical protein